MNITDAIDIMESISGVTDESTPVGDAWNVILRYIHNPTPPPEDNTKPGFINVCVEGPPPAPYENWENWLVDTIKNRTIQGVCIRALISGDFSFDKKEAATPPPEALRPIPVSERLPGPGDCAPWPGEPDATPWCWALRRIDDGWEWVQIGMLGLSANSLSWIIAGGGWSHWLPYNAIPFPEATP